MTFLNGSNPTKLRIGTSGYLEGRRYEVIGRVVLSTADGYKWQEYNLRDSDGKVATLVYESGDWKLFRMFDPAEPMSVAEAQLVRADDTVTINGRSVTVTYVGKSRVVYIEGEAPEGVELNDRASYFNAEPAAGGMFVVSWTGAEMEFYEGHNLRAKEVMQGFNLPQPNLFVRVAEAFRSSQLDTNEMLGLGMVLVVSVVFLIGLLPDRDPEFVEPLPRQAAPVARLAENAVGQIGGHTYKITGHALVEVARSGLTFERHEYTAENERGEPALLVQGLDNAAGDWAVLAPAVFPPEVTPRVLARGRTGWAWGSDGKRAYVAYLLRCRLRAQDGHVPDGRWPGEYQYGFLAKADQGWMLVRWTEGRIWCDMGWRYPNREIAEAFKTPSLATP